MQVFQENINPIYVLTEVLSSVKTRTAEIEAKLAQLIEDAKSLKWGSPEERYNYLAQQYAQGELLGLAFAEGALEGRIGITKIWME